MRTFKYNQQGHSLDEILPQEPRYDGVNWPKHLQEIGEHMKQKEFLLKSILLSGKVDWEDGRVVTEGDEIELEWHGHSNFEGETMEYYKAIPLFTNKDESQEKLWEEVRCEFMMNQNPIEHLREHFTIKRND